MMVLPQTCERALLERFLRAEAMALWAGRAAQTQNLPRHVQTFPQRPETVIAHVACYQAGAGSAARALAVGNAGGVVVRV